MSAALRDSPLLRRLCISFSGATDQGVLNGEFYCSRDWTAALASAHTSAPRYRRPTDQCLADARSPLRWLPKRQDEGLRQTDSSMPMRRYVDLSIALAVGAGLAVLAFVVMTRPHPGDGIAGYFLQRAYTDGGELNAVNVIYSETPSAQIDTTSNGETSDRTPANHGEVHSTPVAVTN